MTTPDPLAAVSEAHADVARTRAAYEQAVEQRAKALRDAHAAGQSWKSLGALLGLSIARVEAASLSAEARRARRNKA